MADLDPLAFGVDPVSVVDRITALGYFLSVQDIESATIALQEESALPPAAFVSIASETFDQTRAINETDVRAEVLISILHCEQAARASADERFVLDRARRALLVQLTAWTPKGADRALRPDRTLLRGASDGVVWGEVLFRTRYRWRP